MLKIVNAVDGSSTEETPQECFDNLQQGMEQMNPQKNPEATLEDTMLFAERAAVLLQNGHLIFKE